MRTRLAFLLTLALALALGALVAGCGSDDETTAGSETTSTSADETTTAPATVDGVQTLEGLEGTVSVEEGDFNIVLDGNPSTGYIWVLADKPDPDIVNYKGFDFEDAAKDAPPGTPQKMVLRFEAVGTGEADLTLNYVPPGGGAPEDTQSGTIVVK